MSVRKLTIEEVEFIAHRLAVELMNNSEEPIPPFSTANVAKLESSIQAPFQTFGSEDLYEKFIDKTTILFYLITKNHCFANGNKRMAVTITLVFCYINNWWLDIDSQSLYELACDVANSKPIDMQATLSYIHKSIYPYLTKVKSN
ncbi:type II toxin-antitoxin system death-on-curing family toxin [bacterium]|nr:type II toxin-antitoxin system death-on-curing family toxin [bacterium]NBX98471.1 type II toxin-antitoxin system death-on-curing family toxin [bacterium]NDC94334.1 type II toxin-antitoxin system death-on-curing family toxin [bacterium]NDD84451.1 type II toxin-antitoxin system death-on-curing family toxin [bacterium]NDG30325.1 type II toxin-antitoxin system death-on-curing family toxin [bacterium]